MVGRGDIDPPGERDLALPRMRRRQPAGAGEDLRHVAAGGRRDVLHDEHGRRQVGREAAAQRRQRIHASGRGSEQQDVVVHITSVTAAVRRGQPGTARLYAGEVVTERKLG